MLNRVLALIIALCGTAVCDMNALWAQEDLSAERHEIETQLAAAEDAQDSIMPLYRLYDLEPYPAQRRELAWKLYNTATNARDTETRFDMIRHLANLSWRSDSALKAIERELHKMPRTNEYNTTRLFVDMVKVDNLMQNSDTQLKSDKLNEYIRSFQDGHNTDPYERAAILYALCTYLGRETRGELLESYLNRLIKTVNELNLTDGSVRTRIYNRASPIYFDNQNYRRAIDVDMRMLHEIDSLENIYKVENRIYHNAPISQYRSYRRILGCYPELTSEQIEDYYSRIQELAKKHPYVAQDLRTNRLADIFYAMGTGNYVAAKELIKSQIDKPYNADRRLLLLQMLKTAAAKTGDSEAEIYANSGLSEELQRRLDTKENERSRELQIVYDISELRQENSDLLEEKHASTIRSRRTIIIIASIAVLMLSLLSVMLFRKNRHNRNLAQSLKISNEKLRAERDGLRKMQFQLTEVTERSKRAEKTKTEFIRNMSHELKVPLSAIAEYSQVIADCIPDNQRPYLDHFAGIINLNVNLVMRLVNDVLDIAAVENATLTLTKTPVSVYSICELAINNVFDKGKPVSRDVEFVFNSDDRPDALVDTDGQRVSQVLMNLLDNAQKFTEKGTISLDFVNDEKAHKLTFMVTDQGRGIPDGKEEIIFERYSRLDHTARGCGLGLFIARIIARLLGGDIKVDTDYHGGARFIFTISTVDDHK